MRTNKNLYLFAAALVAGTMGMTSCSNEVVPEVENNPTYNGESVKTQFALNIPAAKKTRMTGANTQQDGNFLGMQNIKLLPLFSEANTGNAATVDLKQIISLAAIENFAEENKNVKIYSDVNIPVSTTHFLFYAEAKNSFDAASITHEVSATNKIFPYGTLSNTLNGNVQTVGDIQFNLLPIGMNYNFSLTEGEAGQILSALNSVVSSDWKTYAEGTGSSTTLAKLYEKMKGLKAGSANSVKQVLTDLDKELEKLEDDPNSLVTNIRAAINTALTSTLNSVTFPQNCNLPDGAVTLTHNGTSFEYVSTGFDGVLGDMKLDPSKICFPASLTYFVNTPLKATAQKGTITWPSTTTDWKNYDWGANGWTDAVTATTTGIALKNPINYAVANLKTTVKCKTATLEDNAAPSRKVIVPTTGFPVTGILVGGQPSKVDWSLSPMMDVNFDQVVYDKAIKNVAAKYSSDSNPNYTLVLDNHRYGVTSSDQLDSQNDAIYIALELKNTTGTDFYGVDGVVREGATFYLIAKLDPTASEGVSAPGEGNNVSDHLSIFEKDHTTVANLTITSLKSAYNCIPDLRSTNLSLGMAVDLTWENGLRFDVEI